MHGERSDRGDPGVQRDWARLHEREIIKCTEKDLTLRGPSVRRNIRDSLKRQLPRKQESSEFKSVVLSGVLRAVHLDQDWLWLEVTVGHQHIHVNKVIEAIDDIIGPMVKRPVIVHTVTDIKGAHFFRDIEPAE